MPSCYVCRDQNANVRFLKSESVKSHWVALTSTPYDGARLCLRHFASTDIIIRPGGKRIIRNGAIPVSESSSDNIRHDHSYSGLSRSLDTMCISGMMTLATLCMCLFPFLLLLYCSTSDEYIPPPAITNPRKTTPVSSGECCTIIIQHLNFKSKQDGAEMSKALFSKVVFSKKLPN